MSASTSGVDVLAGFSLNLQRHRKLTSFDTERVLPRGLRASSPSRVLIGVDIRSPIIQPSPATITKRSSLGTDDLGNRMDELVVEGRRHQDGTSERSSRGELPGAVERDTGGIGNPVKRLAPPLVGWDTESRGSLAGTVESLVC